MKDISGKSRFIGFFDECGDHSLQKLDADFPLFVLSLVVFEREDYVQKIIPEIARFKLKYWNHEGVNLHSRDIRLANGPFAFLQVPDIRPIFMEELSNLMDRLPYRLFVSGIKKQAHVNKYRDNAASPYNLALTFTLERVVHFLEGVGENDLPIVAESRGKNEDNDLERVYFKIMAEGTDFHSAERFKKLNCPLTFRSKRYNIAGTQMADLCAYPCARNILDSTKQNKAFDIVRKHVYQRAGVSGWKVFP